MSHGFDVGFKTVLKPSPIHFMRIEEEKKKASNWKRIGPALSPGENTMRWFVNYYYCFIDLKKVNIINRIKPQHYCSAATSIINKYQI